VTPAESLECRRRFPARPLRRLGYLAAGGGGAAAGAWLLFGSEPNRLASGEANLLALIPEVVALLVVVAAVPLLLTVFRRPLLVADHYALSVRPGSRRTLLLPWAGIAEVVAATVREEPLLLIRFDTVRARTGDRPGWADRWLLRTGGAATAGYQLAVRMDEFVGKPAELLAALAGWAPVQVRFTDRLLPPVSE
jgi:hypothetical protein